MLRKLDDIRKDNQEKISEFLLWLQKDYDYSKSTIDVYRTSAEQFFRYCDKLTNDNVRLFINTIERNGYAPQTLRLRITALERLADFSGVKITVKRPKFQKKLATENIPTEKEYNRLLDYLRKNDYRWYLYIRILGTTGARISEFLEFKWGDVLIGDVTMRGKGNKFRKFIFSKKLIDEVSEYNPNPEEYVAMGRFGRITARGFNERLKLLGIKVGISKEKMHAHAFRHFFAKMYLSKTKDVVRLAEILGHGSIDTTRIYLQQSNEEQKRDINRNVTW